MTHSEIISAYMVLDKLSMKEMPLSVSYKLFKVKKMLQPQWDFQQERCDAVIAKYSPKKLYDGSLKFKSKAEGEKCANELNELVEEIGKMEINFADLKKQSICLDTDIQLSIADIDALSSFIDFEEKSRQTE